MCIIAWLNLKILKIQLILFNSDLANELNLNVNYNEKEICDFLLGKKNKNKNFFLRHMLVINLDFYYFRRWKKIC